MKNSSATTIASWSLLSLSLYFLLESLSLRSSKIIRNFLYSAYKLLKKILRFYYIISWRLYPNFRTKVAVMVSSAGKSDENQFWQRSNINLPNLLPLWNPPLLDWLKLKNRLDLDAVRWCKGNSLNFDINL